MKLWAQRASHAAIAFVFFATTWSCGRGGNNVSAERDSRELVGDEAPFMPSLDEREMEKVTTNTDPVQAHLSPVMLDPLWSSLPYYCDPRQYPPNIIQNNKACERFGQAPYIGFGLDHEPPIRPPVRDYRSFPKRNDFDDDDDDFRDHRKWQHERRNRFR